MLYYPKQGINKGNHAGETCRQTAVRFLYAIASVKRISKGPISLHWKHRNSVRDCVGPYFLILEDQVGVEGKVNFIVFVFYNM